MAFAFVCVVFGSCASSTRTTTEPEKEEREFASLDPGALIYIAIDVAKARSILDLADFAGISGKQAAQMLDLTDTAVTAVYPPEDPRKFLLAAQGRYPSSRIGFSFTFSSAWKKLRSETGGRYWHSARDNLSVVVDRLSARISSGDPFPRTGGVAAPESFRPIRAGAVLAGWLTDASPPINRFLAAMELPIQVPASRLLFGLYPAGAEAPAGSYTAVIRLETPTESQAKALTAMISMIRLFLNNGNFSGEHHLFALAPMIFANPPVQEGQALILKTGAMKGSEAALLFSMFSVYSN
jgi:hypothetical protein